MQPLLHPALVWQAVRKVTEIMGNPTTALLHVHTSEVYTRSACGSVFVSVPTNH